MTGCMWQWCNSSKPGFRQFSLPRIIIAKGGKKWDHQLLQIPSQLFKLKLLHRKRFLAPPPCSCFWILTFFPYLFLWPVCAEEQEYSCSAICKLICCKDAVGSQLLFLSSTTKKAIPGLDSCTPSFPPPPLYSSSHCRLTSFPCKPCFKQK